MKTCFEISFVFFFEHILIPSLCRGIYRFIEVKPLSTRCECTLNECLFYMT